MSKRRVIIVGHGISQVKNWKSPERGVCFFGAECFHSRINNKK
jgi:hypothetical protein